MNTIKKIYLLLTLALLCQCSKKDNLWVKITDNNFLNALIQLGFDTDGDGKISSAEASEVKYLNINDKKLLNIKGIETFINLEILEFEFNGLTALDVSDNNALTELNCNSNSLANLDISHNLNLEILKCGWNNLTTLDLSANVKLDWLTCERTHLTNLDLSKNRLMTGLNCSENFLTSLDVSGNPFLESIYCSGNTLTSLDISHNRYLKAISLKNMPSLYKVCLWIMPFPQSIYVVETSGSPNIYYSADCSKR